MAQAAQFGLDDLQIGQEAAFEVEITAIDIDRFAALSGDASPLHLDEDFARARGFGGRVVHGAHLAALVSRLVGMDLPGRDCLLHGLSLQFRAPVLAGTRVRVTGVIDQLSAAVEAAVIRVTLTDGTDGRILASGKVNLGFTRERTVEEAGVG